LRYTRSVLYGDTENSYEALMQLCNADKLRNKEAFKKEHDKIVLETFEQFSKSQKSQNSQAWRQVAGKKLLRIRRLLQKYKVSVPTNTLRYFRAVASLDSTIVELNPKIEIRDVTRIFRNISIANVLVELPALFSPKHLDKSLLKWLNFIEKEMA
jgi:hypothetical protein